MPMLTDTTIWIPISILLLALSLYLRRRNAFNVLRGPPRPNFLFGFEQHIQGGKMIEILYKWSREYGTTYMLPVCFGENLLVISDPRAIHKILHDSIEDYPETGDLRRMLNNCFGRGVFWATGEDHKRHRRILNPAFSMNHLKQFLPIFQSHLTDLYEKWNLQLQGKSLTFDIIPWLHKVTLDILGESAFNYQFGALENKSDELRKALSDIETEGPAPGATTTLMMALSRRIPDSIADFKSRYFPGLGERLALRYQEVSHAKGREVMMTSARAESTELVGKDILSILVRANEQEDLRKKLSEEEVLAQISTFIQAGHHTTGYTIPWILYEVAAHPEDQTKIYNEIKRVREQNSGELSASDYDSMTHLTSVIKETLRVHPILLTMERSARKNDFILLDSHVTSRGGNRINSIPIMKGQRIMIDVSTYNKLEAVWGPDPEKWDPSRHERTPQSEGGKVVPIGLFGNLLTFSSGPKGCIGWKFAVMEMQVLVAGLLEKYEFQVPTGVEIDPTTTFLLVPSVRGEEGEGPKLPLTVTPR